MRFVFDSIAVRKGAGEQQRRIEIRGHIDGEAETIGAMDAVWVRLSQAGSGVAVQASISEQPLAWCAVFTSGIHFSEGGFTRRDLPVRIEVSSTICNDIAEPLVVNLPQLPQDDVELETNHAPDWLNQAPASHPEAGPMGVAATDQPASRTYDLPDDEPGQDAFAIPASTDPTVIMLREDQHAFGRASLVAPESQKSLEDHRRDLTGRSEADQMRQTLNALMSPHQATVESEEEARRSGLRKPQYTADNDTHRIADSARGEALRTDAHVDTGVGHAKPPQHIGLRVRDHRGRIVNSLEALRPGIYRLEAVFQGDQDQMFFWSINGVRQEGQNDRVYEVDLTPGARLSIAVAARRSSQQAILATALDLRTEDDFDPPTLTAFGPDQTPVDLDGSLAPGVYRLRATGTGVSEARRSWRVDGVDWGDGTEIAVPLKPVARCGALSSQSVVLRLTHADGGQEFLGAGMKLDEQFVFCGLHWGIRLALVTMMILCLTGLALVFSQNLVDMPEGQFSSRVLLSLLAAGVPVTMLFTVLWRYIVQPGGRDWVNLAWQTMMGGGLTLLTIGSCDHRALLFVPSGLVLCIGGAAILGAAQSMNRGVPGSLAMEVGGVGLVFLAVCGPLIAFDACIPAFVKLLALFIGCLLSTGLLASHVIGRSQGHAGNFQN